MWKRIAAWLFDGLLTMVLAVGLYLLLAQVTGYDRHSETLDKAYTRYETEYGVSFALTQEEYESFTEEEKKNYDAAYDALIHDEEAIEAYNRVISLLLVLVSLSLLGGFLGMEFLVPLLFHDGQTIGKKIFGLGLVRIDGVRVTTVQLFVRAILGKFTVETMIPVYILIMLFFGAMGMLGVIVLGVLLLVQGILFCVNENHSQLHDLMAGTAVVDVKSQRIFADAEELLAYKTRLAEERANRAPY
ncbi:MAG: RDD family protein [Oscillospiraceae bacterium]|nr:RDD family protein [Oscillospiraceae bacterium]